MKTALITGASRGIGFSIAEKLASEGYRLFIVGRHQATIHDAALRLEHRFEVPVTPFTADAGDFTAAQALSSLVLREAGTPDVLVNNAGISYVGLLQDMTEEDFDRVLTTNLKSVFNYCKVFLPGMIRRHAGSIINISSVWGEAGASMEVVYSASKGGVNAFTKALAREVAPSGIRVNAIACGVIDTQMNAHLSSEEKTDLEHQIGLERFGTPAEVAEVASFLASDKASYLTGQILTLDGSFV